MGICWSSIGGQILPTSNLRVFTFAELKTATRNFRLDNLLGEDGFGKVYRGWLESSRNASGTTVAVKKLNTEGYQGLGEWQVIHQTLLTSRSTGQGLILLIPKKKKNNIHN